jgi:penicillin-binding protein 2
MGLRNRQWIIGGIILFMVVVFIGRLGQIQLLDPTWSDYAGRLTEERESTDAARGLMLDRNGELLVANMASYDLMITPRTAEQGGLDTAALALLLNLPRPELDKRLDKARKYSRYRASVIMRSLTGDEYARIAGEVWRFPGVRARRRSVRSNLAGTAGHLIGEYREADADDLAADEWYRLGDFKGKSGLEAVYEQELRGRKGVKYHIVDVRNDVRSSVQSGQLDTAAVPGADVTLTIEASLQQYAERLMGGKRGSVVAIEPQTGEVLALVSAPSFDPDLMTGSRRGVAYDSLAHHPGKPLFNRALRATYRPGSIFKMVQGLIALDEGIIAPSTRIPCNRQIINCHGAHSFDNLSEAIMHSCNPYFHEVMKRFVERRDYSSKFEDAAVGLGRWTERIKGFGFGTDLGGHLPGARPGLVPDTAYYDGIYGRRSWAYSTIYSISIGEGELLVTPLQIANVAAIIANRGWYRTPHAVRDVGGRGKPRGLDSLIETGIDPALFQPVIEAMQTVVEQPGGTARRARVEGLEICGKTGTVQDDPRLEHSIFMAFAPKDNPQIAISVYVENAGAGGRWAAPIASLLIEKYLNDSISNPEREARILAAHDPFPDDR